MKRAIVRHLGAIRDLVDNFVSIGRSGPQSASRFLQAVDPTISLLATHPGIGAGYETDNPNLTGIRVCRVSRFPDFLIFYRATENRVEVVRVLHAARDVDQILTDAFDPDAPA